MRLFHKKNELYDNMNHFPGWKQKIIDSLKERLKNGERITFIHTPKCAGSYAKIYFDQCNIINKGHSPAIKQSDGITFTIIRNPIDRFESFLNYRLGEKGPRADWPRHLDYAYMNRTIQLNYILKRMNRRQITSFYPYRTLTFWTNNVDLCITVDELIPFLYEMGFNVEEKKEFINSSPKVRGKLSQENRDRLARIFEDDMKIYSDWIRKE